MASPTQWTWVWVNSGRRWWTKEAWCAVIHGVTKSQTRLTVELNWTELNHVTCLWKHTQICINSTLTSTFAYILPWLPMHRRNKHGQSGSLYSSPCSGLALHQPSSGVLSSVPNMLSAHFQLSPKLTWLPPSLCTFSLLWLQSSSHTPHHDGQFSVKASSEVGSVPSEPFPASHQHQTEPVPSVLPGLFPQVRNTHAFLQLSPYHLCPWPPGL